MLHFILQFLTIQIVSDFVVFENTALENKNKKTT